MNLTKEHLATLAEARALAKQAADIIDSLLAMDGTMLVVEALGGARWRLTDAAGLVNEMTAPSDKGPTGRGFIVADVYRE